MTGCVYTGVVVKTTNVPAFDGASTAVQKSEIVYVEGPFIGLSDEGARALILANSIAKVKVNVGDPAAPVEVRITKV